MWPDQVHSCQSSGGYRLIRRGLHHSPDPPIPARWALRPTAGGLRAVSWPTANKLIRSFQDCGILEETTGQRRNRVFRYAPYLSLFKDVTIIADGDEPAIQTGADA